MNLSPHYMNYTKICKDMGTQSNRSEVQNDFTLIKVPSKVITSKPQGKIKSKMNVAWMYLEIINMAIDMVVINMAIVMATINMVTDFMATSKVNLASKEVRIPMECIIIMVQVGK